MPIVEHQNVKLKLFEMFKPVEAARSLARRLLAYNAMTMPPDFRYQRVGVPAASR